MWRKTDGVNNRGTSFRRETIWFPETYADLTRREELDLLCRVPDYAE
jgi:hypothetical protein